MIGDVGQQMIRKASHSDAAAIGEALVNSITGLAMDAYDNDTSIRNHWCFNKRAEYICKQMASIPIYVIKIDADICCVGSINDQGEITRCYVVPSAARKGLGTEMLRYLEGIALQNGKAETSVKSSLGAIAFYRKNGYKEIAGHEYWGPIEMVPMQKCLAQLAQQGGQPDAFGAGDL